MNTYKEDQEVLNRLEKDLTESIQQQGKLNRRLIALGGVAALIIIAAFAMPLMAPAELKNISAYDLLNNIALGILAIVSSAMIWVGSDLEDVKRHIESLDSHITFKFCLFQQKQQEVKGAKYEIHCRSKIIF